MVFRFRYLVARANLSGILLIVLFVFSVLISLQCLVNAITYDRTKFAGFLVYSNGMISLTQRAHWNGVKSGLMPLDIIQKINDIQIKDGNSVQETVRDLPVDSEIKYTVKRGGEILTFFVRTEVFTGRDFVFTFILPFSIGMFFLLMGGVLFFLRMKARPNRVFLIFCCLLGLFYTTGFDANTNYIFSRIWLLYPFFGAASLHLFLIFPEERKRITENPWLLLIPYILTGIPVVFHEIFYNSYKASLFFFNAIPSLMSLLFFIDLAILSFTAVKTTSPIVKRKAKALFITVLFASSFGVLWSFTFPLGSAYITLDRAMLLSTIFPIFMAYAILKENIFDIDRVIQYTLIYITLSAVLVGVYFLGVGVVIFFTQTLFSVKLSPLENIVAVLVIVVLFHPLRVSIQRVIRKTFYKGEYELQSSLIGLVREAGRQVDIESFAKKLTLWVKENMNLGSTFYVLKGDRLEKISSTVADAADYVTVPRGFFSHDILKHTYIFSPGGKLRKGITSEQLYFYTALNSTALVLLKGKEKLIGLLTVGRLSVDQIIRNSEMEILKTIGENMGLYAENAINYSEKARQERLAALGKMSALIIHEIKNPLGIIKSSVAALRKRLSLGNSEAELINFIEEETARIDMTVRRVLEYARPPEPSFTRIDAVEVVEKTARMLEEKLREKKINLVFDAENNELLLRGDSHLLHQALLNIFKNSEDAMPEGGNIYVRVFSSRDTEDRTIEHSGDSGLVYRVKELGAKMIHSVTGRKKAKIVIEDEGEGVSEDEIEKIFEPFYSTKQDGTGLGLAITKQIIESHNGRIVAEKKGDGGMRFIIELPLEYG